MYERRPVLIDLLQVDDELRRVVFGEGEDFGSEESDDVVGDDVDGGRLEVGIVDPE